MKRYLWVVIASLAPALGFSLELKGHWALEKSEITYTVTHPLHVVHGKSLTARGKGVCYSGHNEFHVGVLVKSFDSGDKNRDLHMLQVTKAGLYPLIDVKAELALKKGLVVPSGPATADFAIQFAGKKVVYPKVRLEITDWKPRGAHLSAQLTLKLKDFGIEPPSLLTMPVQDEVPVKLDMYWVHLDTKEIKK